MRDPDQMPEGVLSRCLRRAPGGCAQSVEVEAGISEHTAWQPAGPAGQVFPDVLENVRHLQPLTEGDGQIHQCVVACPQRWHVLAEECGQHFADHAGDVIAVAIERREVGQSARRGVLLEFSHALAHADHTARDGVLFDRGELAQLRDDSWQLANEPSLFGQGACREARYEFAGERSCRLERLVWRACRCDERGEPGAEFLFLERVESGFVFNRIFDTAQQVGIAHHACERGRQLRYGECEGARDPEEERCQQRVIVSAAACRRW